MRNILVDYSKQIPVERQRVEIVERKGLGHPDSMCDAIMDKVSVRLCREYLEKIGSILHHNADKSLLVAGDVEPCFGGGKVKEPMLLILGDRATGQAGGVSIPIKELAVEAAKEWIKGNLRFVHPEKHIRYQVELKQGSPELTDIFKRKGRVMGANDTSAAVGYYPMTQLERIVKEIEQHINSPLFKKSFPEAGEDVKVMGFRKNSEINLTISMAFVDRYVKDEQDYFRKKSEILEGLKTFAKENATFDRLNLDLNTLDIPGRGIDGTYLTVTGTSAESADSGEVGRGNRVNGVIPLNRPTCSEAAAGKNPVSHVGKIYNLLTHRIAKSVYEQVPGLEEVYIWLLSQIGKPIDQPSIAAAQVVLQSGNSLDTLQNNIAKVVDAELARIDEFTVDLAYGRIPIC
ncbi:MAG: methionine adenosyltransferase [Candidatus Bathyarchaeota archaeon]|nr:MAG: methionine adenosyltransferase [Candidatus Bathyarchaeota archaeon]